MYIRCLDILRSCSLRSKSSIHSNILRACRTYTSLEFLHREAKTRTNLKHVRVTGMGKDDLSEELLVSRGRHQNIPLTRQLEVSSEFRPLGRYMVGHVAGSRETIPQLPRFVENWQGQYG